MKILIVLTSHSELGNSGEKTGFWIEEFAAPYFVLADAGAEITIASPKGGQPPVDPNIMAQVMSLTDTALAETQRKANKDAQDLTLESQKINNDMINNQAIVKQMRVERINRLQLQKHEDSSFLERIIKNNQTHKRDLFHAQA